MKLCDGLVLIEKFLAAKTFVILWDSWNTHVGFVLFHEFVSLRVPIWHGIKSFSQFLQLEFQGDIQDGTVAHFEERHC